MRFIPQEKGKAAVYLIVILGALGGAAYLVYGRGGGEGPGTAEERAEQAAVNAHAEKINSTMKAPAAAPDIPVEKRPPRGAPNATK